ncbi:hypothetical protein JCM19992_14510 [Thermostilla marina]
MPSTKKRTPKATKKGKTAATGSKRKRTTKTRTAEEAAREIMEELGPDTVTLDRRSPKSKPVKGGRRATDKASDKLALKPRPKVQRRRQIDPTTCERDYTPEEIEFMVALDEYKRTSGRMFPTCSEILEVLRNLGYRKVTDAQESAPPEGGEDVPQEAGELAATT